MTAVEHSPFCGVNTPIWSEMYGDGSCDCAAEEVAIDTPTLTTIPIPAERGDWLALRKGYIGASECAALFGRHPYVSMEALLADKRDGVEQDETRAMTLGKRMEDAIAQCWAEDHGVTVVAPTEMYVRGRLIATIDRHIVGSISDHLEVKRHAGKVVDRIPFHEWSQAQGQMACCGTDRTHFAVEDSEDIKAFVVHRDEEFIAELDAAVEMFWAMVEDGLEPPVLGREKVEQTVTLAEAEATLVAEWVDSKVQVDWHEKELKRLRAEIESILGTAGMEPKSRLTILGPDGRALAKVRVQAGRKGFDQRLFKAEHPDLFEVFQTEGEAFCVMEAIR